MGNLGVRHPHARSQSPSWRRLLSFNPQLPTLRGRRLVAEGRSILAGGVPDRGGWVSQGKSTRVCREEARPF